MDIYRNKRFMMIICVFTLCMLPLLSACVAAVSGVDTAINQIVLIDEKGEAVSDITKIGDYTIRFGQGEGEPRIYLRYEDQLQESECNWDEEAKQWTAAVSLENPGSFQIVVRWFANEQYLEEWESKAYLVLDLNAMLTLEEKANESLFLQSKAHDSLHITAQLVEVNQQKTIIVNEDELLSGYRFQQEGEWEISWVISDENSSVFTKKQKQHFVIDHTKPQLSVTAMERDLTEEVLPHQAQPVIVTLTAYDPHLDEASLTVLLNGEKKEVSWERSENQYVSTLSLEQDGSYTIELSGSDKLQNKAEISSTVIVIDQSAPVIQLFLDHREISKLPEYLNHKALLKCVVTDASFDIENSFLSDGEKRYNFRQQDDDAWSIELTLEEGVHDIHIEAVDQLFHQTMRSEHIIIDETKPLVDITYEALSAYQKNTKISFTIQDEHMAADASMIQVLYQNQPYHVKVDWKPNEHGLQGAFTLTEEGSYQIKLEFSDSAQNSAIYRYHEKLSDTYAHTFLLDKSVPEVNVLFSQPKMTSKTQKMDIEVRDAYPSKDHIKLEIEKDQQQYTLKEAWKAEQGVISGSYEFGEPGSYSLKVQATDQAGNQSTLQSYRFIIDKQAPFISVKRKPQMYLNEPMDLSMQISDAYSAHYEVRILQDQKQIHFYNGEASFQKNLTLDQDGAYEIMISAYDQAGNKNEYNDRFIIDQNAPKLTTSFNELPAFDKDRFITNQNVVLEMKWEDQNLKNTQIHITKNGKQLPISYQDQTLSYEFKSEKDHEDAYQISVFLSDEAGNEYTANYELVIDTYLPSLRFVSDPFQGKARNIAWTPKLMMENEAFQISDAVLYRNQKRVSDYRWGDTIHDDGHYLLSVQIRDEAMNEAALVPPFAFTIDTTPPVVELLEEERKEALLNQNVSVDTILRLYISDALSEKIHVHMLTLDDQQLSNDSMKQDENGVWYYPISFSKEGDVSLFIDVSDEANNHTKQLITYHVLPNLTKEQVKTVKKEKAVPISSTDNDYRSAWILGAMACGLLVLTVRKLYVEKG